MCVCVCVREPLCLCVCAAFQFKWTCRRAFYFLTHSIILCVCVCFSSSYGKLRLQGRKNNNNNSNNKICKKRLKQTTITTRKQRYDIEIQRATCHLSHFRILRLILFWKAHEEERKIEAGRKREKKSWQRCAKERLAGRAEGERERQCTRWGIIGICEWDTDLSLGRYHDNNADANTSRQWKEVDL